MAFRRVVVRRPKLVLAAVLSFVILASAVGSVAFAACSSNTPYAVNSSAPPPIGNWTDTTGAVWSPAGGFPGCNSSDSASNTNGAPTILVVNSPISNSIAGLNISCGGCQIDIQSGGSLTLTGNGTFGSGATLTIDPGATLILASGASLTMQSGSTFNLNGGLVDLQNGGTLQLDTPGTVSNSGNLNVNGGHLTIDNTLTVQSGATLSLADASVDGTGAISNAAVVSQGGGTSTIACALNTTTAGNVAVNLGTLQLTGGGTGDGPLSISAGGAADFPSNSYTLTANGSVSGGGTLSVSGGTLTIGGVTSPDTFTMTAGTLQGAGFLTMNTLTWSGGTMTGSGGTQLNGGGTGTLDGAVANMVLDGRSFNDYGTITYAPSTNSLTLSNGGTFSIYGNFNIANDASVNDSGTAGGFNVFPNGFLNKTGGTGTSTIYPPFSNSATLFVSTGILDIAGSGTSSGGFFAGSGATLAFSAASTTITSSGYVQVDGTVAFPAGSTSIAGSYVTQTTSITGGALTTSASASTVDLVQTSGNLNVQNTFTMTGTGTVSSGSLTGSSTFVVANGASLTFDCTTGSVMLGGLNLQNDGTITYIGAPSNNITLSAATITNNGLFDIQTDQPIVNFFIGSARSKGRTAPAAILGSSFINNSGTFQKSAGSGTTAIDADFTNTGTVEALIGTLDFTGTYTQTSGTTTLGAGDITVSNPMLLNGGILDGAGTLTGDLQNNGGEVQPGGSSVGTINLTGNYTQGSSGKLTTDLNGASSYDTFAISGSGTLDGTFQANLNYSPAIGTVFPVLTFASRTGDFATYMLPALITSSYTPTALNLTVTAPQTDLAAFMNGPSSVNATAPVSYTITIQNNGPNTTAGTTTVVDTLPAGVTGASGSGTGWSCGAPSGGTITCTSTDAIANTLSFPALTITMNAPVSSGNITNSATVSSPYDGNSSNNSASSTTFVNGVADVQIVKSGPGGVIAGQNVTYTVTVTNNGPSTANGVIVLDPTPANLTFVSNSGDCTSSYPCNLNTMTAGQVKVITSTYSTSPNFAGNITNTAGVGQAAPPGGATDPDNSNDSSSVTTNVGAQADLTISKTGTTSANPGQNVTYTITVTNNGPSPATSTVVNDVTPAGLAFVSNTGDCTSAYPCSLGTLAAGQTAVITSTYTVASNFTGASITNSASATSSVNDPNTADNSASATTNIIQQADLSITKSGPPSASPGQLVTYVVTVTNLGPSTAGNVTVSDTPPAGLTFVSNSGACTSSFPCNVGALAGGQTATINATYSIPANFGSSSITNTASVTSTAIDPNSSNDSASVTTPVTASADMQITKTGPASFVPGQNIAYTITVTNNGPLNAANVFVSDPTPAGLAFVSNSGGCTTPFPCSLGTLASGQNVTITSTFSVPAAYSGSTVVNTASVSSSTNDGNATNNSSTATTPIATSSTIDLIAVKSGPANANPSDNITFQIVVTNNSTFTAANIVVADPTPSGLAFIANSGACVTAFPCTIASLGAHQAATIQSTYFVQAQGGTVTNTATVSSGATDPQPANNVGSATVTIAPPVQCPPQGPQLLSPTAGSSVTSPISFSWTSVPNAISYTLIVSGGGLPVTVSTSDTTADLTLPNGDYTWFVEAVGDAGCTAQSSSTGRFSVCSAPTVAPIAGIPGEMTTGQTFTLEWTAVNDAVTYEVQESSNTSFTDVASSTTGALKKTFVKQVNAPTRFFYRVRAVTACGALGPFSAPIAIVVVPVPAPDTPSPSVNVPLGSTQPVTFKIFIPGLPGITTSFFATADKPWISLTPVSGLVGPEGTTITISLDASHLANGTWTGTVLVVYGTSGVSGRYGSDGSTSTSVPVSVNVVTPVTPSSPASASQSALLIPSLGFLASGNSSWRSDIRIANLASQPQKYSLSFNSGSSSVKQTIITIDAGATTALDDFVRSWFGVGPLGDSASGALSIQALDANGKPLLNNISTIVSSKTFNALGNSTLGQFIPATPFSSFIGKGGSTSNSLLTLQQIAQSDLFRTNLGIVEAANKSANVVLSVFNGSGSKVLDVPMSLRAGEQKQLNSFLAQNNVSLTNGHIEVQVTGGDGRVTAYASVVDNKTQDPFFIAGVPEGGNGSSRFVLAGVADLKTGNASWQSDVRVLNSGNAPQSATLTFYPSSDSAHSVSQQITINPGETKAFDNVLQSTFGLDNVGGVLHVTTPSDSPLVVSARTYNQSQNGTVGQFIPAVTPADSVGTTSTKSLQILQLEESPRYRTNVGIAEVTGKPATAELSVVLPDSKVVPIVDVPLNAFEFVQLPVLSSLGVGNVYNARISVRVIDGDGKVTAYGSVIDRNTQDATYVPAQ